MKPWVAICYGKDCRKRRKDIDKLRLELADHADIRRAQCLKICKKAPIIVVKRDHDEICLDRIRGKEIRKELIAYIQGKDIGKRLAARYRKNKRKDVFNKSRPWPIKKD